MQHKDSWMTPDLTEKMMANPVLKRALSDPMCLSALQEFQTNPGEAAKKYGNIPGLNTMFKEVGNCIVNNRPAISSDRHSYLVANAVFWYHG